MGFNDARALGARIADRIKQLPLLVILGAASVLLAAVVAVSIGLSGPRYAVLFDGLSPAKGGAAIAALQKAGIPYRLSDTGDIISVPAPDLGRARLDLGTAGLPGDAGSAWKALEGASMTTSEAATRALNLKAVEQSIRASVLTLSGAQSAQVMLAEPPSTPFLADQPVAKASVVLTGAPSADTSLGIAVAQVVAAAVPGLNQKNVVVATPKGAILFPVSKGQGVGQQMRIQARIEASEAAKIRALLAPVLGGANFRVAVSADVRFASEKVSAKKYGPGSYPVTQSITTKNRIGSETAAMGIPGALSNLPPGATTAPLNPPAKAASTPTTGSTKAKTPPSHKLLPQSKSKKTDTSFAVDETTTTTVPALWSVQKVNVAVVVNKAAIGTLKTKKLQSMIASTITIPGGAVTVTSAAFVPATASVTATNSTGMIVRGTLLMLAALAALFGVVRPLVRWLRTRKTPSLPAPLPKSEAPPPSFESSTVSTNLRAVADQVDGFSRSRPEVVARVLEGWIHKTAEGEST